MVAHRFVFGTGALYEGWGLHNAIRIDLHNASQRPAQSSAIVSITFSLHLTFTKDPVLHHHIQSVQGSVQTPSGFAAVPLLAPLCPPLFWPGARDFPAPTPAMPRGFPAVETRFPPTPTESLMSLP